MRISGNVRTAKSTRHNERREPEREPRPMSLRDEVARGPANGGPDRRAGRGGTFAQTMFLRVACAWCRRARPPTRPPSAPRPIPAAWDRSRRVVQKFNNFPLRLDHRPVCEAAQRSTSIASNEPRTDGSGSGARREAPWLGPGRPGHRGRAGDRVLHPSDRRRPGRRLLLRHAGHVAAQPRRARPRLARLR